MSGPLAGLARRIAAPSTIAGLIGAALAVLYAVHTIELPAGTLGLLLGCISVFVFLAVVLGDRYQQGTLGTLRKLGAQTLPASKQHLAEAVRELARLPDVCFWVSLACWFAAPLAIGLSYGQLAQAGWSVVGKLIFVGFAVGPLVAILGYLVVVTGARKGIGQVAAAGLTSAEVIAAIPPGRLLLQRRLLIFTGVAVGSPLLFVVDLLVLRTEALFARVLEPASSVAQASRLSTELDAGLWSLLGLVGGVIAVVTICGWVAGSALGAPIGELASRAKAMAKGKLGGALVAGEDELWAAVAGFTTLETRLVTVVTQLLEAGQQIEKGTDAIAGSRAHYLRGAGDQSAALAQTSATTEELARSAKQIATNATHVAGLASQTLDAARQGKLSADQFYGAILKVREGNQAIADSVVKLNKRVQQVGRIVEFIDGIADKSDLLALNAELEGNKAGEVGRGFSLVAAEMRRLAESVMTSTREIIGLIHEVRDATNAAVMATEAGVKASDTGSALALKVSEGLSDILGFATKTADSVQRITLATHQQQLGTDQLAQAMSEVLHATKAGEAVSKRMSTANDDLKALALELKTTVGRFEVS